ncbi:AAA family ATPase [Herbiconiux sp. P15]|uniref:AAA family ATPase n=1 Tax=Herbiconiux liukaitaii TaxID=3342799 RepID=UPI0035B80560
MSKQDPPSRPGRLHGRERQLRQALQALERPGPRPFVLVTGRPGVGRTAFLETIAAQAGAAQPGTAQPGAAQTGAGRVVHIVRGRADLAEVPLGALAPLLAELPAAAGPEGSAIVEFHRLVNRPGVLLIVDDADQLDAASCCVLEQVAQAGAAALVLSVATGRPPAGPPSTRADVAAHATVAIDLPPLTPGEAHDLVKERLGPLVGTLAAEEIVRLAAGSTRTLAELIDAAAVATDLHDDAAPWREHWPHITRGLVASLPADPLHTEPLVADLLALVAVAGEVPVEQAGTSGASERGARRAEALGFVCTVPADGRLWVRLAHPLYASVVLTAVSELDRADFCAAGADMLDGYPEHRVRRTLLQLRAGQEVPPRTVLDQAHQELSACRYSTAITLGRHAVESGHTALLRATGEYVQAQASSQVGRIEAATGHFEAAWLLLEEVGDGDPFLVSLARAHGNHLAFRVLKPDQAIVRIEAVLGRLAAEQRVHVEDDLAKWRVMAGHDISPDIDALRELGPVQTPADLNLLQLTASLHTMGGNLVLAEEAVAKGLAACDRFSEVLPNARDLFQLSEVLVLSFTGRFADARLRARTNLAHAESSNPSARGMWRFALAMIELHTGSPARAWKHISEGRRDLVWRDIAGLLPAADALSAAVAARTGRFAVARSWLDQLTPAEIRDPKVELYASLARAWVAAAAGRRGFAIRSLAPVLHKAAAEGNRYLAALMAYEAVRIDPVVGATVMLPTLVAAKHAFPLSEAHARAVVSRHDVLPIAKQLADAGLLGPAIDAARWVAEQSGDDIVRASHARRLADSWTVRTGISMTPRHRQAQPRVMPLTDREWQLASGAASLRTSAELAAEFGISVRTVDNHLARIYKKLGIASRRELATELGALQLDRADTVDSTE